MLHCITNCYYVCVYQVGGINLSGASGGDRVGTNTPAASGDVKGASGGSGDTAAPKLEAGAAGDDEEKGWHNHLIIMSNPECMCCDICLTAPY